MTPGLDLRLGVDEHHRSAAAALYYDAFFQLLAPLLGERAQALPLLASALDLERAVAAVELWGAGDDRRNVRRNVRQNRRQNRRPADDKASGESDDANGESPNDEHVFLYDRSGESVSEFESHIDGGDDNISLDDVSPEHATPKRVPHRAGDREHGRLVGICGLHFDGRHFVALRARSMLRAFGLVDGLRRILIGGLLDHQPRAGELVIDGIAVLPAARGRGIGALLLGELERFARAEGLRALSLDVAADNERASELYRRCGFVERRSSSSWLVRRAFGITEIRSMSKRLA